MWHLGEQFVWHMKLVVTCLSVCVDVLHLAELWSSEMAPTRGGISWYCCGEAAAAGLGFRPLWRWRFRWLASPALRWSASCTCLLCPLFFSPDWLGLSRWSSPSSLPILETAERHACVCMVTSGSCLTFQWSTSLAWYSIQEVQISSPVNWRYSSSETLPGFWHCSGMSVQVQEETPPWSSSSRFCPLGISSHVGLSAAKKC